jgi:hypothetical protein
MVAVPPCNGIVVGINVKPQVEIVYLHPLSRSRTLVVGARVSGSAVPQGHLAGGRYG